MAVCLPISAFSLVKFHTVWQPKNKNKNSFAKCVQRVFFGGKNAQNSPYFEEKIESKVTPYLDNRDIRKVRKTMQQYPEFGNTQGEFQKKPAKKYISIHGENHSFDGFLSFTLSFFFTGRLHCCYIYFHYSYLYSYYNSSRTLCIK